MKSIPKLLLFLIAFSLLAAACDKVELKHEIPTSPKESYEPIPQ